MTNVNDDPLFIKEESTSWSASGKSAELMELTSKEDLDMICHSESSSSLPDYCFISESEANSSSLTEPVKYEVLQDLVPVLPNFKVKEETVRTDPSEIVYIQGTPVNQGSARNDIQVKEKTVENNSLQVFYVLDAHLDQSGKGYRVGDNIQIMVLNNGTVAGRANTDEKRLSIAQNEAIVQPSQAEMSSTTKKQTLDNFPDNSDEKSEFVNKKLRLADVKIYACNICPKTFLENYELILHLETHKAECGLEEYEHFCEVCHEPLQFKHLFSKQKLSHKCASNKCNRVPCKICKKVFLTSTS